MITKIALTAAVIFGTASVALASESDPNLFNRYPGANMTKQVAAPVFEGRNVALTSGKAARFSSQRTDSAPITGGGY